MLILDLSRFPQRPATFIPIKCVPVLYRPILGSPEQFVVGVLCVSASGTHLVRANRLDRLSCLYGNNAEGVIVAVNVGIDDLEAAAQRVGFNVHRHDFLVSGMRFGEENRTEDMSMEAAGKIWLSAHSSLFTQAG